MEKSVQPKLPRLFVYAVSYAVFKQEVSNKQWVRRPPRKMVRWGTPIPPERDYSGIFLYSFAPGLIALAGWLSNPGGKLV